MSGQEETARYVYGVARAGVVSSVETPGVNAAGGAVRVVEEGDVAALVSAVPDGPLSGTKDDVLAHSSVLEEVITATTVLPMRFGVVMPSEQAVRDDLLRPYADHLRQELDALDGCVQLRVRAFYQADAALREIVSERPDIAKLKEAVRGKPDAATYYDRIRLGELVAQALEERRERDGDWLLDRLAPYAVEIVEEAPVHEQMVLNASLLVERARVDELVAGVEQLGHELEQRIQLRAVGPLPPYSFVELPDVSREGAWA